jgi:hypothetical protein
VATQLSCSVPGASGINSAVVSDSFVAATSTATVICTGTSKNVGDAIEVNIQGNKVFEGYVKAVDLKAPEKLYTITAANVLIRAVDYFLASTNPDTPFSRSNISAEDLVGDLMEEAGITAYTGQASGLTLGVTEPIEINLTSAYDYSRFLSDLLAFHLYADINGTVHFDETKPYYTGGGIAATIGTDDTISINYSISDRDLRNRVVVYGMEGVFADAKASSPYLPAGFYKSVVIASPVIYSDGIASQIANYNLNMLNRLTQRISVSIIGNSDINCLDNVHINNSDVGVNNDVIVYACEHNFSRAGYITSIEGRF